MYAMTPDEDFILDSHPAHRNVCIAAGFSGHGFKFGSVIGEILADLAQYRQTRHNIELFSHERFAGKAVHQFSGEHGALVPTGNTAVRRHALRQVQQITSPHQTKRGEQSPVYSDRASERRVHEQMEQIRSLW